MDREGSRVLRPMSGSLKLLLLGVAVCVLGACASSDSGAVLAVGSRNVRCSRSEIESELQRESSSTREYFVGCDFTYTRVLCSKPRGGKASAECYPARPQPPCFGGGCFKENPETFEWELDSSLASADPEPSADSLFATP
jgi:hypothetical protein